MNYSGKLGLHMLMFSILLGRCKVSGLGIGRIARLGHRAIRPRLSGSGEYQCQIHRSITEVGLSSLCQWFLLVYAAQWWAC